MTDIAIQTQGLSKRFGERIALESIDLQVPRGCAFGFLGPNGAGKTTLIRLLLGLAEPTSGRMRVLGHDLPGGRAAALARVGAIVEEPRFHGHLTGRENLHVHAAARDRAAHGRVDGALARVGLGRRGDDRVKTYSLGRLAQIGALGDVRYAIPSATARIGGDLAGEVALAVAILVVAGWMAVTLGAGLWRTRTQEI